MIAVSNMFILLYLSLIERFVGYLHLASLFISLAQLDVIKENSSCYILQLGITKTSFDYKSLCIN